MATPRLWNAHYGKIAFMWSTLTVAPLAALHGTPAALAALAQAALGEYLSFIILLTALYVVAGGILVTGRLRGTPLVNTAILALGTVLASIVGTTGAAMILIRPLLRANSARLHNVHVVVFFIFLAANIGGAQPLLLHRNRPWRPVWSALRCHRPRPDYPLSPNGRYLGLPGGCVLELR